MTISLPKYIHRRCNCHHTALSHLDKRNTYVRMLFIDYSSAFNTIVISKLIKLEALGLNPILCNLVLDFTSQHNASPLFDLESLCMH